MYIVFTYTYIYVCIYITIYIYGVAFLNFISPLFLKKKKCSNGNAYKCIIVKFIFFK